MDRDITKPFHYGVCEVTGASGNKQIRDLWAAHREGKLVLWLEDSLPETGKVKPAYV